MIKLKCPHAANAARKYDKNRFTRAGFAAFFSFFLLCLCLLSVPAKAEISVLYETKDVYELTKGVTYQRIRQVTGEGMRDIFTLSVNISDPNITFRPVESKKTYSLKEPLTEFLKDAGAFAGVNGDFFGMAGNYSASFGPVISNGKLISATSGINNGSSDFSAFFISNANSPFLAFVKTYVTFLNNGVKNIEAFSLNKITDMVNPVVLTRAAFSDTSDLDKRFAGLYKITVKDNVISHISTKGQTVDIPENGYVLVMSAVTANNCLHNFRVGDKASLQINSAVDYNGIKTSIGGGARILSEGALSYEGEVIKGRHPRTAIGISQDKKTVYLVAVDGRTHSIGATHEELADIMKKTGAYDAMHLDGGGSTTMAVTYPGQKALSVVNRVSDGSQRNIINGLGIFNDAPAGQIKRIVASVNDNNIVYAKSGVFIDVYGADDYLRRIDINQDAVKFSSDDPKGFFAQGLFYPQSLGEITLNVSYLEYSAQVKLNCREIKELRPEKLSLTVMEGEQTPLHFTGIDAYGIETPVNSPVSCNVTPSSAGFVENGVFYPKSACDGYIQCRLANVTCYVKFHIGGDVVTLEKFSGGRDIKFTASNEWVKGAVSYATGKEGVGARLSYVLPASDDTVAAYLTFPGGVKTDAAPIALRIGVYGDMSGVWLRARVKDAKGETRLIDLAGEVNWQGLKTLNAYLSPDFAYPITLEALYAVKTAALYDVSGELFFYDLCAVYERKGASVLTPEPDKFTDPLRAPLGDIKSDESYDITVLGRTKPYASVKSDAYKTKLANEIKKGAKRAIYLGPTDMPLDIGVSVYKWNENYTRHFDDNVCLIQMCAAGGGIAKANVSQWGRFVNDIIQSGKKNAVILMDNDPLYFSSFYETRLFCDALTDLTKIGINVFVISARGFDTTSQIIGGVRYINLASYWKENGAVNENFKFLRFRVSGQTVKFDLY